MNVSTISKYDDWNGKIFAKTKPGAQNITIIEELKEFKILILIKFFDLKNKKTSWCKCRLSGLETFFFFEILLINENKFSKAGYQSNNAI